MIATLLILLMMSLLWLIIQAHNEDYLRKERQLDREDYLNLAYAHRKFFINDDPYWDPWY